MGRDGESYAFPKGGGCQLVRGMSIAVRRTGRRPGVAFIMALSCIVFVLAPSVVPGWAPPAGGAEGTTIEPLVACEGPDLLGPLQPAMVSNVVWELKHRLHELGFDVGSLEDERYDAKVQAAVRAFQRAHGLQVDGIVGPQTWAALAGQDQVVARAPASPAPSGEISIVVDTERLTLTIFSDGQPYKTYPVAVGRPKSTTLTPVGEWRVIHKGLNWGGGFGTRWLGLNVPWGIYGIHGTNNPSSIGTRASAGCIRMFNRDVEELYEWVPIGARVLITGVKRPVSFDRTLRTGAQGPDVVEVQLRLNALGFDVGDADGRFGPNTERAVRRLQQTFGLPVDGQVWADVYYILGLK